MRRLIQRLGALAVVGALLGGGLALASGSNEQASAHTGDLSVTAVCNTATGNYDFTAKLTTANTGLPGTTAWRVGNPNFEGTPQNANGMQGAIQTNGAQTITLTQFTLPGNTTGYGPWVYARTTWTDGYGIGSDGQLLQALAGDCTPDYPGDDVDVVTTDNPWVCTDENVTQTITTTTVTFKYENGQWVEATRNVTTSTATRPFTPAEAEQNAIDCAGPQPEDKVTYTEWVDGDYACDATEVPQTRTKTAITSVRVGTEWIEQPPVVTTENTVRPLTAAEQEAADIECAGSQPENKVVFTEWVDGEYQCGDTTVQMTRQATSTEYVREGATWVEGESVTTTQTETRALTLAEIDALNCQILIPPVTPPATEEPPATPEPSDGLAATGGDVPVGGIVFASVLILLAAGSLLYARRKANASAE